MKYEIHSTQKDKTYYCLLFVTTIFEQSSFIDPTQLILVPPDIKYLASAQANCQITTWFDLTCSTNTNIWLSLSWSSHSIGSWSHFYILWWMYVKNTSLSNLANICYSVLSRNIYTISSYLGYHLDENSNQAFIWIILAFSTNKKGSHIFQCSELIQNDLLYFLFIWFLDTIEIFESLTSYANSKFQTSLHPSLKKGSSSSRIIQQLQPINLQTLLHLKIESTI